MAYVSPIYPTDLPDLTDLREVVDDVDDIIANDHNDPVKELIASLEELGTLPKGDHTTVSDRLDYMQPPIVDRGDPVTFDFTEGDLTTNGTWQNLDLSGILPSSANMAKLWVQIQDDAINSWFTLRKKGNSNDYNRSSQTTQTTDIPIDFECGVFCDTNQVIEYIATNTVFSAINITVQGYTKK